MRRIWASLAFIAPLALYIASLVPDVAFWDTGEMQTVPYILGIAHPTGFPAFVLSGWIFSHVMPFGNVAWRLSLMSAAAMAVTAYAVHALALRLGSRAPTACAAGCAFAVGEVAWTHGTRAEVHAFAAMCAMLAILHAVILYQTGTRRALYLTALWLGLGLADHPVLSLVIPGLFILALRRRAVWLGPAGVGACAVVIACLSLYLYLPLRSAYVYEHRADPTLALGLPVGKPYWDYDHPSTWSGFKHEVLGEEFGAGSTVARLLTPQAYIDAVPFYAPKFVQEYGPGIAVLALAGLLFLIRDDPWLSCGLIAAAGLAIPFAVSYRQVESDVDRYFLASYAVLAACAAIGVERTLRLLLGRMPLPSWAVTMASVALLSVFAVQCLTANTSIFRQHHDYSARRWITYVRSNTPPDAVIIASWNYATPLAYAAYVEQGMGRRVVETAWLAEDRERLDGWMRALPVYTAQDNPQLDGYVCTRVAPSEYGLPPLCRIERLPR